VWVATTNLTGAMPQVAGAIQRAFLALTTRDTLARVDHDLAGFQKVSPQDYDKLEADLAEASKFDSPR